MQSKIESAICKISISPNGKFIAYYRRDGVLTVISSSFTTKILDFDTRSESQPLGLVWCGSDSLVLLWSSGVVMVVGPYGDWLDLPMDAPTITTGSRIPSSPVYLVSEVDCCRIITGTKHEILQKLSPSLEAIHQIGSTHPAALIYDSMTAHDQVYIIY